MSDTPYKAVNNIKRTVAGCEQSYAKNVTEHTIIPADVGMGSTETRTGREGADRAILNPP